MHKTLDSHIEATADVCGGKPRIAGHRVKVQDIVIWHERLGLSADEICEQTSGLELADVHAALAYYYDHREEIDHNISEEDAIIETLRKQYPSKLQR